MLKSVSDLIELPYEEAKEALKDKITNTVTTGIHTGEKILMLRYVAEFSSDKEPVTNKNILDAMEILEKGMRDGLAKSMGRMQGRIQGYIGTNDKLPNEYYIRDEVLSAYEEKHGVCIRTDFSEILNELLESYPITPEPYKIEPIFPEITADTFS